MSSKSNPGPLNTKQQIPTTQRFSLSVHTAARIPTDYYVSSSLETTSFGYTVMRQTCPPSVYYGLPTSLRPTPTVTRVLFFVPNRSQIPTTQTSIYRLKLKPSVHFECRNSHSRKSQWDPGKWGNVSALYLTHRNTGLKCLFNPGLVKRDRERHTYAHILRLTGPICSSNIYYPVLVWQSCGHFLPCNMAPTRSPYPLARRH
jgi:hypothetical protein